MTWTLRHRLLTRAASIGLLVAALAVAARPVQVGAQPQDSVVRLLGLSADP